MSRGFRLGEREPSSEIPDPAKLREAARAADKAGDTAHAVALRKAALFAERRLREQEAGCAEVALWM